MEQPVVTCSYVLTRDEYRTFQVYWRQYTWWRGVAFAFIPVLFFGSMLAKPDPALRNTWGKLSAGQVWDALNPVLPHIIILGLSIYGATRLLPIKSLCSTAKMKRVPGLLDQKRFISIGPEGIHAVIGERTFHQDWNTFSSTRETQKGFALHYPGFTSALWLPKYGFSSSTEIDRCRTLFQAHAKKFQKIS